MKALNVTNIFHQMSLGLMEGMRLDFDYKFPSFIFRGHTANNAIVASCQFYRLVNKLQHTSQFHQVRTSDLQACCNVSVADSLQLVESDTSQHVDNKF